MLKVRKKLKEGARFCCYCGVATAGEEGYLKSVIEGASGNGGKSGGKTEDRRRSGRGWLAAAGVCLAVCLLLAVGIIVVLPGMRQRRYENLIAEGNRYLEELSYEEAIVAFTKAIEIDPRQVEAYLGRASAYIYSGETEENLTLALDDYDAVLELDESEAEAWLGITDIEIRQGDSDRALENLREALEKSGNNETIVQKIKEIESGSIFDTSGNIRERRYYGGNGELWFSVRFSYDMAGKLTEVTSYDATGTQNGHADISYREDGQFSKSYVTNIDMDIDMGGTGGIAPVNKEYDEAGNCIKEIKYTQDGFSVKNTTINSYDNAGNRVREEVYKPDGELNTIYESEYDESGKAIKRTECRPNGEMKYYSIYEYDSRGNRIKDSRYNEDGSMSGYTIYEYDQNGKLLGKRRYKRDGSLMYSMN